MIDFIKHTLLPSKPAQLIIQTVVKWYKDQCLLMGAALSYYAIFSLFPLILVALNVAGALLGPETDAFAQVLNFAERTLPPGALEVVEGTLINLSQQGIGAGLIGFVLLLLAASSVFSALIQAVDVIWKTEKVAAERRGIRKTALTLIGEKLATFALVLSTGMLILLSLLSNIAIRVVMKILAQVDQSLTFLDIAQLPISRILQVSSSALILSITILLLLRFLPSTRTPWKDIWPGALLTTTLLLILQRLVASSVIEIGGQYRSYGVIGGVMILLIWIYLTCQIFFLGCEFSYVYAHMFGSRRHQTLADFSDSKP